MDSQSSRLLLLPDELLGKIYSYISDPDSVKSLHGVCKRSDDMATGFCCSTATRVSITMDWKWAEGSELGDDWKEKAAEWNPYTVEMDSRKTPFASSSQMISWLNQVLAASAKLQSLSLCLKFSPEIPTVALGDFLESLSKCWRERDSVKTLDLDMEGISREILIPFSASIVQNYPNVTVLSMCTERGFYDSEYYSAPPVLPPILSGLPTLQQLKVEQGEDALHFDFHSRSMKLKTATPFLSEPDFFVDVMSHLWYDTDLLCQLDRRARHKAVLEGALLCLLGHTNMKHLTVDITVDNATRNKYLAANGALVTVFPVVEYLRRRGIFEAMHLNTDEEQLLTVNLLLRWVTDGVPLAESVEVYNNTGLGIDCVYMAEILDVDGCRFISRIPTDGVDDQGLTVEKFWELWKGEKRAEINLRILPAEEESVESQEEESEEIGAVNGAGEDDVQGNPESSVL